MIVGFDLVGQEDVGKPLYMFIDKLLANRDIDYMFHAGETGMTHIICIEANMISIFLNMLFCLQLKSNKSNHIEQTYFI